jgi:hypothetical protein
VKLAANALLSYSHFRIKFAMRFRNHLTLEDFSHDIRVIDLRDSHAKYVRATNDKVYLKEMQYVSGRSDRPRP